MVLELQKSLEKLGLTEKEAVIYLAALEMDRFSVLSLAKKTGVKRPTCYLVLDDLIKRGLISTFPKAKKVLYVAEHPNTLLKQSMDSYTLAKQLMPELQNLISVNSDKPELKVFVGQAGMQNIFNDFLENTPGKEIYYIASVAEMITAVGEEFLTTWVNKRIKLGIKTISIRMKSTERSEDLFSGTDSKLRNIRYAPDSFYVPYSIHIYGKKVAFVSTKKDLFGFIVESADLAQSMKALFDVVWGISSDK